MARKLKCPECGTMNEKENTVHHKQRYYCPNCLKEKQKKEEKSKGDWQQLIGYIFKIYNGKPNGMVYSQLATYKKPPYNYTDLGMLLTLKYFFETLGNKTLDGRGVGIIPFMYEEAKQNYIKTRDINNHNKDKKPNKNIKYVKVVPSTSKKDKDKIDFETLETRDE